jgi:hypothetical protein
LLPLRDGGGARYVGSRGEPNIAWDVVRLLGTSGKHKSPRREHPQLGNAKVNPGRYDLRRQSATRLAFAATLPDHHRTSEKNCSNNPRSSSGGPSLPSLMFGIAA